MTPAPAKVSRTEVSDLGILASAEVDAFKTAIHDLLEQAAEGRLSLGQDIAWAITSALETPSYVLHPEEAKLMAPRACTRKRLELACGRAAAHRAIAQLGFNESAGVQRGDNGEPLWPDGITGSITHCHPWNVAVAARTSRCLAMGVDLETQHRMEGPDISHLICRDAELIWLHHGCDFREHLAMIFSAKEALYKALYPFYRRYIDFKEVELLWCPERGFFSVQLLPPGKNQFPVHWPAKVHCRRHNGFVFSAVIQTQD